MYIHQYPLKVTQSEHGGPEVFKLGESEIPKPLEN